MAEARRVRETGALQKIRFKSSWLRHFLRLLAVLLGVSLLTFSLAELAPGDPAEIILQERNQSPDIQQIEKLRKSLGLGDPLPVRYLRWLQKLLTLDLGDSWLTGEPVLEKILSRLPATLELALCTFIFVVFLSTVSGVFSAWHSRSNWDRISRIWAVLSVSLPNYWLGLLLIWFISLKAGLLPVMGRGTAAHLVLPVITLGLGLAAGQGRVLRATVLEVMGQDYIRFAFATGLPGRVVVFKHLLINAIPAVLGLWGVTLGSLLGGAVIVENVFAWPGLGKLAMEAILSRDLPVVQGVVLVMALVYVLANQTVDLLHGLLDSRVRLKAGHDHAA